MAEKSSMVTSTIAIIWGESNETVAELVLTVTLLMAGFVGVKWFFKARAASKPQDRKGY